MKTRTWVLGPCVAVASWAGTPTLAQNISSVTVEVSPTRSFVPLQSYGHAHTATADLFFGGLTDMGLHLFASGAFPRRNFSQLVIVVDRDTGQVMTGTITHLSAELQEALTITAPAEVQFGFTLYLYGGYGPAIVQTDFLNLGSLT